MVTQDPSRTLFTLCSICGIIILMDIIHAVKGFVVEHWVGLLITYLIALALLLYGNKGLGDINKRLDAYQDKWYKERHDRVEEE